MNVKTEPIKIVFIDSSDIYYYSDSYKAKIGLPLKPTN